MICSISVPNIVMTTNNYKHRVYQLFPLFMAVDKIRIGPDRIGSDRTDKTWIGSDRTHKTWIGSNSIKETHIRSLKVDAFQIPIKADKERSRK